MKRIKLLNIVEYNIILGNNFSALLQHTVFNIFLKKMQKYITNTFRFKQFHEYKKSRLEKTKSLRN